MSKLTHSNYEKKIKDSSTPIVTKLKNWNFYQTKSTKIVTKLKNSNYEKKYLNGDKTQTQIKTKLKLKFLQN